MEIKTRRQAHDDGDKVYFTGRACQQGHLNVRYVSTGTCKECAAQHTDSYRHRFVETRTGVVVLRGLTVPRKHLRTILAMVDAYMAMEGLLLAPPPDEVEPRRPMTPADAAAAAALINGSPLASVAPRA